MNLFKKKKDVGAELQITELQNYRGNYKLTQCFKVGTWESSCIDNFQVLKNTEILVKRYILEIFFQKQEKQLF